MKVWVETLKYAEVTLLEDAGYQNARFMRHATFRQLVENVKKDGALTQIPFAWKDDQGRMLVVSGNHRVKAARAAGLVEGPFLVTDEPLTPEQMKAIQLSHNAIGGEDDPAILKALYESITAVDLKQYAGLDDKMLELLATIATEPAPAAVLEWTSITMAFLPDEAEALKRVLDLAMDLAKGESLAVRMKEYEAFMEAISVAGAAHNITNTATAFGLILAIFQRHLVDLQEGWVKVTEGEEKLKHKGWVPLASIFGTTTVPAEAALVMRRAVQAAIDKGDVLPESRWRLIELQAADYLAS